MDLNYLFLRHQTSLMRASSAGCTASRMAHVGLVRGYAHRIDAMQRRSGASFPLLVKAADGALVA